MVARGAHATVVLLEEIKLAEVEALFLFTQELKGFLHSKPSSTMF